MTGCVWRESWRVSRLGSGRLSWVRKGSICIYSLCCCVCVFSNVPVFFRVRVYVVDAIVHVSIRYDVLVIDGLIL